ncbi:Anoctamin-7 [Blyttiomyces sp. JEL0837]|nr:Anoctamin-7 [Blyttiomyces sp. JEL0837]
MSSSASSPPKGPPRMQQQQYDSQGSLSTLPLLKDTDQQQQQPPSSSTQQEIDIGLMDVLDRSLFGSKPAKITTIANTSQDTLDIDEDELAAALLEKEAFGEKREILDLEDDDILTRHYRGTCVHFMYQDDLDLFDEVVAYKKTWLDATFEQALERFILRQHGDVMVRIAYSNSRTHWDAILKYDVKPSQKAEEQRKLRARAHFERELLRNHLILVRERGRPADPIEEDLGMHYIKIMAPFAVLCDEAELIKLKMEVNERYEKIHRKIHDRITSIDPKIYHPSAENLRRLTSGMKHRIDEESGKLLRFKSSSTNLNTASTSKVDVGASNTSTARIIREATSAGIQVHDVKEQRYQEGHDGSLREIVRYMFALVPVPIAMETEPFKKDELSEFKGGDVNAEGASIESVQLHFFSNAKRNLLVNLIANRCRVHKYRNTPTGIDVLLKDEVYDDFYAVHDGYYESTKTQEVDLTNNRRAWLYENWAKARANVKLILTQQPLPEIREYFGEKIAFFFSWLSFYTLWLLLPSILGIIVFIYGLIGTSSIRSESVFDNAMTVPFAFFMSLWSILMLEFWKRQSATLRAVWDVHELKVVEHRRPEWYGTELKRNYVTGKIEPHFAWGHKLRIRTMTTILTLGAICMMIGFEIIIIIVHAKFVDSGVYISTAASAILTLLNIVILTPLYLRFSLYLNQVENHHTMEGFEDQLIRKNFMFNFVNNYSTLLYVGIVKVFAGPWLVQYGLQDQCTANNTCMSQLTESMAIIFVGLGFIAQFQSVLLPLIFQFFRKRSLNQTKKPSNGGSPLKDPRTSSPDSRKVRSEVEIEIEKAQHVLDDILDNWDQQNEIGSKVVQFGFIVLFSMAFPLAPLLAFISNSLEIRFAAYRLLVESQRPFVLRAQSIGAWGQILNVVARIGILVNASILAFSSTHFHDSYLYKVDDSRKIVAQLIFIFVFEHAVFLCAYLIDTIIPDIPTAVKEALQRDEYLKRVANGEEAPDPVDADELDTAMQSANTTIRAALLGTRWASSQAATNAGSNNTTLSPAAKLLLRHRQIDPSVVRKQQQDQQVTKGGIPFSRNSPQSVKLSQATSASKITATSSSATTSSSSSSTTSTQNAFTQTPSDQISAAYAAANPPPSTASVAMTAGKSALSGPAKLFEQVVAKPAWQFTEGLLVLYRNSTRTMELWAGFISKQETIKLRHEIKHIESFMTESLTRMKCAALEKKRQQLLPVEVKGFSDMLAKVSSENHAHAVAVKKVMSHPSAASYSDLVPAFPLFVKDLSAVFFPVSQVQRWLAHLGFGFPFIIPTARFLRWADWIVKDDIQMRAEGIHAMTVYELVEALDERGFTKLNDLSVDEMRSRLIEHAKFTKALHDTAIRSRVQGDSTVRLLPHEVAAIGSMLMLARSLGLQFHMK